MSRNNAVFGLPETVAFPDAGVTIAADFEIEQDQVVVSDKRSGGEGIDMGRLGRLGGVAIALGLGWGAYRVATKATAVAREPGVSVTRARLLREVGNALPANGPRLAGFIPREGVTAPPALTPRALKIARELEAAPDSIETARDRALLAYLGNDPERAATLLAEKLEEQDSDAYAWAELAGYRRDWGLAEDRLPKLLEGLEAADKALTLDPRSSAALYQKSWLLDLLHLRRQAIESWEQASRGESDARWKAEVERRLQSARAENLAREQPVEEWRAVVANSRPNSSSGGLFASPPAARRFLEEEAFPGWAAAMQAGDTALAGRLAEGIRTFGRALSSKTQDPFFAAISTFSMTPAQEDRLASGFATFAEGLRHQRVFETEIAEDLFARAERAFAEAGSPMALRARQMRATCLVQRSAFPEASALLSQLLVAANKPGFRLLEGSAHLLRGWVADIRVEPTTVLSEYRQALPFFRTAADAASEAAVLMGIARAAESLGDREAAWEAVRDGLRAAVRANDGERLSSTLAATGDLLSRLDHSEPGRTFLYESLTYEKELGDPLSATEALWSCAEADRKTGRLDASLARIREARAYAREITSPAARAHENALLDWTEGAALAGISPDRALEPLGRALAFFEGKGYPFLDTAILLASGKAKRSLGDLAGAEQEYRRGIRLFEQQRARITATADASGFFADAEGIFDELIDLLWTEGRSRDALLVSEQGRARSLLDATQGAASPVYSTSLPPGADAAIVFEQLPNRLLMWWLTSRGTGAQEVPWSKKQTKAQVERLRGAINEGRLDERHLTEFSRRLLGAQLEDAPSGWRLAIVADGDLAKVPFGLLRVRGKPLVLTLVPSIVPSLTAGARSVHGHAPLQSILIVADPEFSRSTAPALEPLEGARAEPQVVGALYPSADILAGAAANRAAVLSALPSADVIQFSAHAVLDERRPERSRLVLATAGEPSDLSASEISVARLRRRPIVVLGACSTLSGAVVPLEGNQSLARAFLVAGARAVLASLWPVDDSSSAAFFIRFHRALLKTGDGATALAMTQAALATEPTPLPATVRSWAGFQWLAVGFPVVPNRGGAPW